MNDVRIMLVDDNAELRRSVREHLARQEGLKVVAECGTGLEALEALGKTAVDVIRELKEQGRTMLVVTHEMEFARHVADKVVFFADGVIEEEGAPEELFTNPKSPKTAAFLKHSVNAQ